jgi:hypothetical protein
MSVGLAPIIASWGCRLNLADFDGQDVKSSTIRHMTQFNLV